MNERIKELAREAALAEGWGPEVWQTTFTEKLAELIIRECIERIKRVGILEDIEIESDMMVNDIKEHLGVEEPKGWVCNKCGTDRTKSVCPYGHTAALTGECPMVGVAQ